MNQPINLFIYEYVFQFLCFFFFLILYCNSELRFKGTKNSIIKYFIWTKHRVWYIIIFNSCIVESYLHAIYEVTIFYEWIIWIPEKNECVYWSSTKKYRVPWERNKCKNVLCIHVSTWEDTSLNIKAKKFDLSFCFLNCFLHSDSGHNIFDALPIFLKFIYDFF